MQSESELTFDERTNESDTLHANEKNDKTVREVV